MLEKYTEHNEHIFCAYLQYADYTDSATLPIGVKGRRKEKKRRRRKRKK